MSACDDACTCGAGFEDQPIACTLSSADDVAARVEDWRQLLSHVTGREGIDGGLRLRFPGGAELAADVARLASAEAACCAWFDFTLRLGADVTALDVRAPATGQDVLAALFGAPG